MGCLSYECFRRAFARKKVACAAQFEALDAATGSQGDYNSASHARSPLMFEAFAQGGGGSASSESKRTNSKANSRMAKPLNTAAAKEDARPAARKRSAATPEVVDAAAQAGDEFAIIDPLEAISGLHAAGDEDAAREAALVFRLRRGDAGAFEELLREVGPRLFAVAKRFLANDDDAREAMQDAMLSAYRSLSKFDERSRLSTWLHRIVVNASLMKLRTKRRKPSVSLDALSSGNGDGDGDGASFAASLASDAASNRTGREARSTAPTLEENDLRQLLREQMEQLPDEYRTVLLLRDVEELDTLQTARVLGVSESAVKTRLHRARLALRTAMLKATGKEDTSTEQEDGGIADMQTGGKR
jgi:RNA polymerase sigma-70 factor (ECF subfamily)